MPLADSQVAPLSATSCVCLSIPEALDSKITHLESNLSYTSPATTVLFPRDNSIFLIFVSLWEELFENLGNPSKINQVNQVIQFYY